MDKNVLIKRIVYWLEFSATFLFLTIGIFLWFKLIYSSGHPQQNLDSLVKAGLHILSNSAIDLNNYQLKIASIEYIFLEMGMYLFWVMVWAFTLVYFAQTKLETYLISVAIPAGITGLLLTPPAVMLSFIVKMAMQGAGG